MDLRSPIDKNSIIKRMQKNIKNLINHNGIIIFQQKYTSALSVDKLTTYNQHSWNAPVICPCIFFQLYQIQTGPPSYEPCFST